jgi:hypothetical protein
VSEYFEVLAARIDAPLLDNSYFTFFHQLVFDIPQTIRFFGNPEWSRPSSLTLVFNLVWGTASINFPSNATSRHSASLRLWEIRCERLDWRVISVAQICSQILPFRSSVKSLHIMCYDLEYHSASSQGIQQDEIDPTIWTRLFHSFTSVQSLVIPATLEPSIAPALQGRTGESAAEVFPSLHSLLITGNLPDEAAQKGIQSFIAARQHSGRLVAVSRFG